DDVITHPFQIGDEVRREHDVSASLRHHRHEVLKEFPPGEWVEARDGLIENQKLRAFCDRQSERELSTLPARQASRSLASIKSESRDSVPRDLVIPPRVHAGSYAEMIFD